MSEVVGRAIVLALLSSAATLLPASAGAQTASGIPLVVRTTPAVEGVAFHVGARAFESDATGVARTTVPAPATYRVRVAAPIKLGSDTRIDSVLWGDGTTESARLVPISSPTELRVGLNLSYLVRAGFTDRDGTPVDATEVDSVTFAAGGRVNTVPGVPLGVRGPTAPKWQRHAEGVRWMAGVAAALGDGLRAERLSYDVRQIVVRGERMGATSEPFVPAESRQWTIAADAYAVELRARDALFGIEAADEVTLARPGRPPETLSSGDTTLLPAGVYEARARASGIPFTARFSVPDSDSASARVLSPWDMGALALLFVVVGALLIARSARERQRALPEPVDAAPAVQAAEVSEPEAREPAEAGAEGKPGDAGDAKEYVRVHMRSGRSIEGWVSRSSGDQVMLLTVAMVHDAEGREVASTPLDSFLARSRIERVEHLQAPVDDPSRPQESPSAPQLRMIRGEDGADAQHPDKRDSRSAS